LEPYNGTNAMLLANTPQEKKKTKRKPINRGEAKKEDTSRQKYKDDTHVTVMEGIRQNKPRKEKLKLRLVCGKMGDTGEIGRYLGENMVPRWVG